MALWGGDFPFLPVFSLWNTKGIGGEDTPYFSTLKTRQGKETEKGKVIPLP